MTLGHLGMVAHERGDYAAAEAAYRAALAIHRELGNPRFDGQVQIHLGRLQHARGQLDEAEVSLVAAEQTLRAIGEGPATGWALAARASIAADRDLPEVARAHLAGATGVATPDQLGAAYAAVRARLGDPR